MFTQDGRVGGSGCGGWGGDAGGEEEDCMVGGDEGTEGLVGGPVANIRSRAQVGRIERG